MQLSVVFIVSETKTLILQVHGEATPPRVIVDKRCHCLVICYSSSKAKLRNGIYSLSSILCLATAAAAERGTDLGGATDDGGDEKDNHQKGRHT